ncbi:hypothetical protein [Trinickia sp. Y13]|uniref:hypothetical protein n=1 Tax=Trinickia sp. Y13 TaxID=2917807 RepID=UPI0024074E8C|nr:hypothetical protein [Trinickia sp. Y13]MDG0027168.1 hypothetical protein [Trinickia sp. Y13]
MYIDQPLTNTLLGAGIADAPSRIEEKEMLQQVPGFPAELVGSVRGIIYRKPVDDGPKATENDDVKETVCHGWKPGNAALPTMPERGKPTPRQGFAAPGYARP